MQRFSIVILVIIVTLYGSPRAFATHPQGYYPEPSSSSAPAYAPVPHIALLLPLQSPSFGDAARSVKQGFVAASEHEAALPLTVRVYSTTDDPLEVLITYHQALDAGAVLIVGPLTRNGVMALATSRVVEVPTLALNAVNSDTPLPSNLYFFGLQMESEAAQIAEMALYTGKSHAIIVKDAGSLSLRLQNAFADRWLSSYGNTAESIQYDEEQAFFTQLRKYTDGEDNLVFLALDADKTRRIRSYLDPETPVYATSQIFVSEDDALFNHDLNGINFVDMPWVLQPDHPAVMAYRELEEEQDEDRDMDEERLYAMGIDAFRLMAYMLKANSPYDIAFNGVTGQIRFAAPAQFVREPVAAQIEEGQVQLLKNFQSSQ